MPLLHETLGTIATEPLLQNVTLEDSDSPILDAMRIAFEKGFQITAEWETVPQLSEEDKKLSRARFAMATDHDEILEALRSNKRLARLILEPKT